MSDSLKPRLAAIAPWVGHSSNVWMHRQFDRLSDQMPLIITWEYMNREQFPLPKTDVRIVPTQFAEQLDGWPRKVDTLLKPKIGGERFGGAFRRWFREQMLESKIDGIIGQFGHFAMAAEVASRPLGIPTFAHFHGYDITARLSKRRYRKALQSHWHAFAGMVCVANYQRDWLLQQGYAPESVALIPCGAPTREIKRTTDRLRRERPTHSKDRLQECHFLFIGRLVDKKDPISLLKAFAECFRSQPHARLNLAGFGPLESDCRNWIAGQPIELQKAIRTIGTLSPQNVLNEMVSADVYVQHSRTAPDGDKEGWPVVIAEAMAAGMPIVSTRHAGIVDQVVEGKTGYLSDEGDWKAMGANMARIASDRALQKSMAEKSQHRMMQFDAEGQIQQLREFMLERISTTKRNRRAA